MSYQRSEFALFALISTNFKNTKVMAIFQLVKFLRARKLLEFHERALKASQAVSPDRAQMRIFESKCALSRKRQF